MHRNRLITRHRLPGLPPSSQEKEAHLLQLNEMRHQTSMFEAQLAQAVRTSAQAERDTSNMRESYEQGALLASDDAEQKRRTSVEVR